MEIATAFIASLWGLLSLIAPNSDLNKSENQLRILQIDLVPSLDSSKHDLPIIPSMPLVCPDHENFELVFDPERFFGHDKNWYCRLGKCQKNFNVQEGTKGSCLLISSKGFNYLLVCKSCNGLVQNFREQHRYSIITFYCLNCHKDSACDFRGSYRPLKNFIEKTEKEQFEDNFPCPTQNCKGRLRTDSFELGKGKNKNLVELQFCDTCDEAPYTDKTAAKKVLLNTEVNGERVPKDVVSVIRKFLPATKILLEQSEKLLQ